MSLAHVPPPHMHPNHSRLLLSIPLLSFILMLGSGCSAPEDGRLRGQLPGGDGGNYSTRPVFSPSKLDGSRPLPPPTGQSAP